MHLALTTLKSYSGHRSRAEIASCNVMTGPLHGQVRQLPHVFKTDSLQHAALLRHSTEWITSPWFTSWDLLNSLVPGPAFWSLTAPLAPWVSLLQGWLLALSKDPYSLIIYISKWGALTQSLPSEFHPGLSLRCIYMTRQHQTKQAKMHSEIEMKVLQCVFLGIWSYTFVLV